MRLSEARAALKTSAVLSPAEKYVVRQDLLAFLALAFINRQNEQFRTLMNVEGMAPDVLRAHPTAETPFEVVEKALAAEGYPTDGTVGGVMNIVPLTQDEIHHLACYCHYGDSINGVQFCANLRSLQAR